MTLLKKEANRERLQNWLTQKAPNDYWQFPQAPPDFALQMRARLLEALESRTLPCEHVIWHLTNRCNLRCRHCGVWGGEKEYTDISIQAFLEKAPELLRLGLRALTLTGGEPFLNRDIFLLVKTMQAVKVKVAAVTNGYFIQRDVDKLNETPLDSLSISLDGLADSHNYLRASATSFERVMTGIRLAAQTAVPIVNVNTSVYPQNLAELPALREEIFAAGAHHWVLRPVALSGRAQGYPLKLSDDQLLSLLHFVEDSIRQGYDLSLEGLGYLGPWDSLIALTPFFSYAGWTSLYILPDGQIKGFNDDLQPVEGHFLTDDLADIWFTRFRSYRFPELPPICNGCPFWGACGGGNLAEADSGWRCIRDVLLPFAV